jgi:hypothetical protein
VLPGQLGVTLLNLCELLQKHPSVVSGEHKKVVKTQAFWNVLTLKYLENQKNHVGLHQKGFRSATEGHHLEDMLNSHLGNVAEFYARSHKFMMAEGLFRQAIQALEWTKLTPVNPYSMLTTKLRYGQVLKQVDKREAEAQRMIEECEQQVAEVGPQRIKQLRMLQKMHVPRFYL